RAHAVDDAQGQLPEDVAPDGAGDLLGDGFDRRSGAGRDQGEHGGFDRRHGHGEVDGEDDDDDGPGDEAQYPGPDRHDSAAHRQHVLRVRDPVAEIREDRIDVDRPGELLFELQHPTGRREIRHDIGQIADEGLDLTDHDRGDEQSGPDDDEDEGEDDEDDGQRPRHLALDEPLHDRFEPQRQEQGESDVDDHG